MSDNNDSFLDSLVDAFKPGNILIKIVQFFVFALITATPYLIYNLDQVSNIVQAKGATGFWIVLEYFKALLGAMWKGMFIGLSTLWSSLIHMPTLISDRMIGTALFSIVVLIFATLTFYQPIRLIFNVLDMKKGRKHPKSLIFIVSIILVVLVASPISYLFLKGETITTGVNADKEENQTQTNTTEENITQTLEDNEITNSINMLDGGG